MACAAIQMSFVGIGVPALSQSVEDLGIELGCVLANAAYRHARCIEKFGEFLAVFALLCPAFEAR